MKIGMDVLLTIILVILKVTGVIKISWFLVFLPMVIGTALMVLLLMFVGIVAMKAKSVVVTKNGGKIQ